VAGSAGSICINNFRSKGGLIRGIAPDYFKAVIEKESAIYNPEYYINTFKCKIKLDLAAIDEEKKHYKVLPKYYDFGGEQKKRIFLLKNLKKIYAEIEEL